MLFRVAGLTAALLTTLSAPVLAVPAATDVGPWVPQDSYQVNTLGQGQGLATVARLDGSTYLWYTGETSIPAATRQAGWDHVGDPDSVRGYVVEPYQRSSGSSKMFRVWTPDPEHTAHDFFHSLVPGEALNNSFAAISPDGQWLVSGEWGTMSRLLVHPMPMLNPQAPGSGSNLPLAGTIRLNREVRDVQGCVFMTPIRLLCSSDDPAGTLFGVIKPLLRVDLARPLNGANVTGYVTALGQVPQSSWCSGAGEVEGLDYDRATANLRVENIQPGICIAATTVFRLRHRNMAGSISSGMASSKCVDINGGLTANGARVQIWDCNGSFAQHWTVQPDGTVTIGGKCLDLTGGGAGNGTTAQLWACHGGGNQFWSPQSNGSLLNPASGRCLDIPASNTANGTQLAIWDCHGAANQRWLLP